MNANRVNEIDLLRFLAALMVVFFHYSFRGYAADALSVLPYPTLAPVAKYGYLGVELFFIISGFVILMTAAGGSLKDFVVSRFVRLYPAFWACCTITFAAILLMGAPRFSATASQYLVNMTMLSEFFGVKALDGAYWSLFVELRFYALVAIVLLLGRIRQAEGIAIAWLLSSIVLEIVPVGKLRTLLIVDYSAYFIAGATFFIIWSKGLSTTRACVVAASWALALHQSLKALPELERHFGTEMSVLAVSAIITSFFVVMLLVSTRRTGAIGGRRWLMAGVLTYPLYLLHQNIGFILFNVAYPTVNPHLLFWGTVALMLAAAYLVNVCIERTLAPPLKRHLNLVFDSLRRLALRRYRPAAPRQ